MHTAKKLQPKVAIWVLWYVINVQSASWKWYLINSRAMLTLFMILPTTSTYYIAIHPLLSHFMDRISSTSSRACVNGWKSANPLQVAFHHALYKDPFINTFSSFFYYLNLKNHYLIWTEKPPYIGRSSALLTFWWYY